ncbi:hypothetical protein GIW34_26340, partial [Pseudomonas syringae]|nr:hypothetical protein [Pseudomonas syringae]MCF5268111.1 hypothetical protein [Pseudomonas syringae]
MSPTSNVTAHSRTSSLLQKPVSTCRRELVREADIADAEITSSVTTYSRTSSLLQKPVSTCRSELVREDAIADAEI